LPVSDHSSVAGQKMNFGHDQTAGHFLGAGQNSILVPRQVTLRGGHLPDASQKMKTAHDLVGGNSAVGNQNSNFIQQKTM
jgi:hypothetical protein